MERKNTYLFINLKLTVGRNNGAFVESAEKRISNFLPRNYLSKFIKHLMKDLKIKKITVLFSY